MGPAEEAQVGYPAADFAARQPWRRPDPCFFNAPLPARCYQATVDTWDGDRPTWFVGISWWNQPPRPSATWVDACDYMPQPPALDVLKFR
jgi:hypothetical protein